MSVLDVIPLPGHLGMFARRVAVEAWLRAGSPRVNSAGRLYALQKYFYDGWRKRLPGFQPADNPDDETQRLAHVRFVAFDIDPTADRIKRLTAAGFVRPYRYEPWHWELPNVRSYAIVRSIPATAGGDITPIIEEEQDTDMRIVKVDKGTIALVGAFVGYNFKSGEAFSYSAYEKAYGAETGFTEAQVAALVTDGQARYKTLVNDVAAAVAKLVPASGSASIDYAALAKAVNDDAAKRLAQ